MSSTPFCLGVPVVDRLPLTEGCYVLRADTSEQLFKRVRRYQQMITPEDEILVREIGYRPDHPVPLRKFFAEVIVKIGPHERNGISLFFWHSFPGKCKGKMIY